MKLHLIAIGGTGMGALAGLLKSAGHEVRGSDAAVYPPMSDQLAELKIPVMEGFLPENLDWGPDRVVVGNVCSKDHVEVVEAEKRGLPLASLPAMLSELFLAGRKSLVVAGTHGKTTTAALLSHILTTAGRNPGFFIGGVPVGVGRGWDLGDGGDEFVVEGDEYDSAFFDKESKFLHYRPHLAVLTSVELDHVDIFSSMEDVRAAFRKFVALIPEDGLLVTAASCREALAIAEGASCRVETYAFGARSVREEVPTWHGDGLEILRGGRCRFRLARAGEHFSHLDVSLFGEHNLENVIGAVAIAASLGVSPSDIRDAVATFAGVRRRQQIRGLAQGVYLIDDYAHHPTAIAETLKGLRDRFRGRRMIAVYEPRSATSRRRTFQHELVESLAHADTVVVGRLHAPEKIPEEQRLDPEKVALELHQRGTTATHIESVDAIVAYAVDRARPGDVIAVLSSGWFDGLLEKLIAELGDAILPATPADIGDLRGLLELVGLDATDIRFEDHDNFFVLRNESGCVGAVGLEIYGEDAILRSLAVSPSARGQGYGWMLADTAVAVARHRGVKRIYLLTPETASDFFAEKLGFRVVDRATVSDAVANSTTFRQELDRSPMTMRLDL